MSGTLQQRIDTLIVKTNLLTQRYADMVEANNKAQQQIKQLEITVSELRTEISELKVANEHLRVVSTLTPNRENIETSREFFVKLLRDIDKCINELNE